MVAPDVPGRTVIDLSALPPDRSRSRPVPIRYIVGASPSTGRWAVAARGALRTTGWVAGIAAVGAGLVVLWLLLFSGLGGGDVWSGRPLPGPGGLPVPAERGFDLPPTATATGSRPPASPSPATGHGSDRGPGSRAAGSSGSSGSGSSGSGGSARSGGSDDSGSGSGSSGSGSGGSGRSGGSDDSGSRSSGSGSSGSGSGGSDDSSGSGSGGSGHG